MNKRLTSMIKKAFNETDLTVRFGKGWVNIQRPDGIHCEFYNFGGEIRTDKECYLSATYTVSVIKDMDINLNIPDELGVFVNIVKDILGDV